MIIKDPFVFAQTLKRFKPLNLFNFFITVYQK